MVETDRDPLEAVLGQHAHGGVIESKRPHGFQREREEVRDDPSQHISVRDEGEASLGGLAQGFVDGGHGALLHFGQRLAVRESSLVRMGVPLEPSRLVIGSKTIMREHVTINPGTEGGGMLTSIGSHCLLMVGAHVAHDCRIGDHVVLVNNATLAGHVTVGDHAILGGLCAVHQFVRIGAYAFVGGMSGQQVVRMPYDAKRGFGARELLATDMGRIRDIREGLDGLESEHAGRHVAEQSDHRGGVTGAISGRRASCPRG